MKRPAVFFDRDNTLIASDGYLGDPDQVKLIPGAADAIARARALGYATVVVSNQSGVARGMFTEDDVRAVNAKMEALLLAENSAAIIDRHEYCPFHPKAPVERYRLDSELRKPKPGMILKAAERLALDLEASWMVGDAPRDIEAGHAAGCKTILYMDPSVPPSPAARETPTVQPDYIVSSLNEAMDAIEGILPPPPASIPIAPPDVPKAVEPRPVDADDAEDVPESKPESDMNEMTEETKTEDALRPPQTEVTPPTSSPTPRIEMLADQILQELRRQREAPHTDFSVSKLLAGIVQILVLAVLFYAYLNRNDGSITDTLLLSLTLQTLTIALLIMGRQR